MKYAFISQNADVELKNFISSLGKNIIEIQETHHVYEEISDHPDIYLCTSGNTLILAKEQIRNVSLQLNAGNTGSLEQAPDCTMESETCAETLNHYVAYLNEAMAPIKVVSGSSAIGHKYPNSCIYNGVQLGEHFFHNIAYTDSALLDVIRNSKYKIINVMQGYTNCNIVVVDENSIITSDMGIARTVRENSPEIDVLIVQQGFVQLKGFKHGFLGGASGKIDEHIIFNGNLKQHPDFEAIKTFIEIRNLKLQYFENYPLTDIGSILGI
ncbi:MAG: DUF6873 family GME fold protein [Proteocatella sp.]